jgi:hypothetical protein
VIDPAGLIGARAGALNLDMPLVGIVWTKEADAISKKANRQTTPNRTTSVFPEAPGEVCDPPGEPAEGFTTVVPPRGALRRRRSFVE